MAILLVMIKKLRITLKHTNEHFLINDQNQKLFLVIFCNAPKLT